MMHGHPAPPQHMGHPPPPPPHLTHLTSVPPPSVPPQGPRINNNRHHHHPRVPAGDHHQQTLGPPHMVPLPHQQQQHGGSRKPHYGNNNGIVPGGGIPPKHHMGKTQQPYSNSNSSSSYRTSGHGGHHSAGGIPVVSAAGNLGTKTRMIPAHEPKPIHNHTNVAPPAPVPSSTAVSTVAHHASPAESSAQQQIPGTPSVPVTITTAPQPAGPVTTTTNNTQVVVGSVPPPVVTTVPPPTEATEDSQQMQPMSQLLSSVPENLANTKEKTPMCLVNELARYNKCQHQYRLTGESGPAHKKRFTVTLKLGDEEYTAEGPSIKKAQHSAANEAIAATKYKHPPAKINRIKVGGKAPIGNITPTVELNALAMKRGEPTVYETEQLVPTLPPPPHGNFFTAPPPPNSHYGGGGGGGGYHHRTNGGMYSNPPPPGAVRYGAPAPNSYNRRGLKPDYHSRGYLYNHHHHMQPMVHPAQESYKVTLHVGERTFLGEGITLQAARHDAAARALEVLKPLTPETTGNASGGNCHDTSIDSDDPNSELKSPISLVHELALKRKMAVQFEVHSEKGPPHMKVFTTICKVGTIVTEGEGNGKKISKKRAAEKMLDELRNLPPTSPEKNVRPPLKPKRKLPLPKKKTRNLIKENGEEDPLDMVNPISRLMQIQQARKEKEPEYTLVEERGMARRREFIMEVLASGKTASGVGPTKKIAKKEAAESLLVMLGYGRSTVAANVSSPNKENQSANANEGVGAEKQHGGRKAQYNDGGAAKHGGSAGRQIVPGVLQLNSGVSNKTNQPVKEPAQDAIDSGDIKPITVSVTKPVISTASSATINVAAPPPAAATTTSTTGGSSSNPDVGRKKEQLMYLAQLLKFEVMFSDFPKGNHGEYLTLVTLSTDPPQLCHGSGASLEESHDEAARGALEILSKIGLDNVKPKGSGGAVTGDDSKSKK
ncbi:double-stranded RNA-binding protein Staufen homolog 2 [Culex pipiens pallens]|uniref:double-stranded RNA-binding protein Staufen homolog 2 n=1 Tax=Culex pipiens pallens TaxID=42434 RepID=UPI00195421B5|nr:double-stranded RNA-binding protein Staufen homolog 2 [Culex pipiens pallens]